MSTTVGYAKNVANSQPVLEAERTLLSTLLAYPDTLAFVDVQPEDFLDPDHAMVCRTIYAMADKGEEIDPAAVMVRLYGQMDPDKLIAIGTSSLALPTAVERMSRAVREAAIRRRLVAAAWKVIHTVEQTTDLDETIAEVERLLTDAVGERPGKNAVTHVEDVIVDVVEELSERYEQRGRLPGVPTGSRDLDALTGGYHPAELVILAARPSMGKTAWMLHSATSVAQTGVAMVFSLEMSRQQLGERLISSTGRIPMYSIRTGKLREDDWQRVSAASVVLSPLEFYVDDSAGVSASYIRGQLRRMRRHFPDRPMVAFVDYLQIVEHKGRSQAEEYGAIAASLKNAAKEVKCTVVALSQLNRQCEMRQNKRPVLSDVRGSGEIEQTADLVIGLYRDAYYNPDTPEPNVCELIVLKHRNGPTGTVKMRFDDKRQWFSDLADRGPGR